VVTHFGKCYGEFGEVGNGIWLGDTKVAGKMLDSIRQEESREDRTSHYAT